MLSVVKLKDTVNLPSKQIGSNIKERVMQGLQNSFEKKILGKINGYVIKVVDINEDTIKDGVINDINGDTNYNMEYTAVVFKPVKNDVVGVTVKYCNDLAVWGTLTILPEVDIIECICPNKYLNTSGFHHDETQDQWINNDNENKIHEGSEINIRIINTQIDATKISIIGELVDD